MDKYISISILDMRPHICVSKLTIIGSYIGLSPDRRQAIIWTNAGILLIGPLGTIFSEILIEILTFSFKKMRLKVSSAKRRPFCLGLNVLSGCLCPIQCGWQMSVETSDNLYYRFIIHDWTIKVVESRYGQIQHFDKIHFDQVHKS